MTPSSTLMSALTAADRSTITLTSVALTASEWIMPGDLFPDRPGTQAMPGFLPLANVRDAAERRQIERALEQTDGQVIKAAELLGIGRSTLWEKMTRLGVRA